MKTIKPNGRRLLVEVEKINDQEIGGIILPQSNEQTTPREAVVIEVGSEVERNEVQVGANILISKNCGVPVKLDDVDYTIIDMCDLVAVIND